MIGLAGLGLRWLECTFAPYSEGPRPPAVPSRWLGVACPHCTNIDTLTPHCTNRACGWVGCTCGALVYSRRRHRHPRHGSDADTCHAPATAA